MKCYAVISVPEDGIEPVCRILWADDEDHCEEQFINAIPDERISWILAIPTAPAQAGEDQ